MFLNNVETLAFVHGISYDFQDRSQYAQPILKINISRFKIHTAIKALQSTRCWMDILVDPML